MSTPASPRHNEMGDTSTMVDNHPEVDRIMGYIRNMSRAFSRITFLPQDGCRCMPPPGPRALEAP